MEVTSMKSFQKWVFGAGNFNVAAAFPLATPFLDRPYYALFNNLKHEMGLGGPDLEPPVEGVNLLLINTAGLALVGLILIYASTNLKTRIGIPFLNAVIRLIFSGLRVYYMIAENISRILVSLEVVDIVIAGAFLYFIFQFKTTERMV